MLLCVQSQFVESDRGVRPVPVDQSRPRCGLLPQSVWLVEAFMRPRADSCAVPAKYSRAFMRPRLDSCSCFYAVSSQFPRIVRKSTPADRKRSAKLLKKVRTISDPHFYHLCVLFTQFIKQCLFRKLFAVLLELLFHLQSFRDLFRISAAATLQ